MHYGNVQMFSESELRSP